jgi:hypothetical protein
MNSEIDNRHVNVNKLKTPTDCNITKLELEYAINTIKEDLHHRHDEEWRQRALSALRDFEHKLSLVNIKLDSLLNPPLPPPVKPFPPTVMHSSLFYKLAKSHLPKEVFERLQQLTKLSLATDDSV